MHGHFFFLFQNSVLFIYTVNNLLFLFLYVRLVSLIRIKPLPIQFFLSGNIKIKILYNLIIFLLYCDNRPDIFYKEYIKNIN